MALSDRHWIMGALVACAFVAAAKLPPEPERRPRRNAGPPEVEAQERARRRLRQEHEKLLLLQRRDSALALAARASRADRRAASADARGNGLQVFFGRDVPATLRARIDSLIDREVVGLATPLGAAPVVVLVVTDTATPADSTLPGPPRAQWIDAHHVLPSAADGRTCVSIVGIGQSALRDAARPHADRRLEAVSTRAAGSLLGPCAWFAAHGMPGPHIERWLAQNHWLPALRAPAAGTDTLRLAWYARQPRVSPVERLLDAAGWSPAFVGLAPDAIRCAAGEDAGCRSALRLTDSMPDRAMPPALLRSSGSVFDRARWPAARPALGSSAMWMIASLHDRLGAEAFGRFWRSELEPERAYASAAGAPLSAAAATWIRETYDIGELRHGPHPLALVLELLLAGLAVGIALAVRGRIGVRA